MSALAESSVEPAPAPAPAPPVGRRRLARGLAVPLGAYAASRLLAGAAVALLGWLRDGTTAHATLTMWDGGFYVMIARDGYPDALTRGVDGVQGSVHAFFPAYPAFLRVVHDLTGTSWPAAAVLTALLFGAAATVLVWHLAAAVADDDVADRAAILFAFFPGSFVFSLAYSEGVMLTFALACLWALVRERWVLAGLAAAVATATRPNAVVLVASCAWAAAVVIHRRREWSALLAPAIASTGFVGFLGFLWWRTGEATAWFLVQRGGWDEGLDFGVGTWDALGKFAGDPFSNVGVITIVAGTMFAAVGGGLLVASRLPAPLKVYAFGVLALALFTKLLLRPRFVFTAAPVLIAVAQRVRGSAFAVLVGAFAAALPLLILAYGVSPPITGAP